MTVDLVPLNHLTQRIIGAAIEVHRHLGPGPLESIYQEGLARELASHQLAFTREHSAPVIYKDLRLPASYRLDLVVEGVVVVEIKSVASLNALHQAQILTYMRIADCPVGLLINFNVPRLIDGVMRLVNGRTRDKGEAGRSGIATGRRNGGATE
jgi:GxxExxY protein